MAMNQNEQNSRNDQHQLAPRHSHLLDALLCEEEKWEEDEGEVVEDCCVDEVSCENNNALFPLLLLEQDLFWEDEELVSLLSKEQQQNQQRHFVEHLADTENRAAEHPALISAARREAVLWMLKVHAHYGFTALTAILAVNYFDRFISSVHFQRDKPWMVQLAAVTCLSLAAKVDETQVPLLLDLQVEDSKYVFEAKTIQRMELLVLSALQWRMHPVTPISFLDHIIRRLGLKTHLHWEFLKRCERLLLTVAFDSRFVGYLPSVLATATMLSVIDQVEPSNAMEYQNQLLSVLKISKEKVNDCYNLILELSKANDCYNKNTKKRGFDQIPGSPSGVIDAYFSYDESSNESWAAQVGSPVSSFPEPFFKRAKTEEKLASLSRLFVGIVGSPP